MNSSYITNLTFCRIPTVIAQFDTKYIDETGQVLDTRTYNVDLNSGKKIVHLF